MKPKDAAGKYDRVAGNVLVGTALVMLLVLPFFGLFGLDAGPRWVAESRFQTTCASIMTVIAFLAGCALRGRLLARKLVCLLAASALATVFLLWFPSPACTVACILVAGALGASIFLSWTCAPASSAARGNPTMPDIRMKEGARQLQAPSTNHKPKVALANPTGLLVCEPNGPGNEVVFKGTRIRVRSVLAKLAKGESFDNLLEQFPALTLDHLQAAVAFAASSAIEDRSDLSAPKIS